jgi:O-antigen/teichoic acid export membrane protein
MTGILYSKKTKLTAYITFLSLIVIVIWNIVFIPIYGLVGAATSNLAGYVVRLLLIYMASKRLYPIPFELRRLSTMLVVAIGLYLLSQLISFDSPYVTTLARTTVVASFPLFLFLGGFFHDGERKIIIDNIRKGTRFFKLTAQNIS